jgi:hypothetical protein
MKYSFLLFTFLLLILCQETKLERTRALLIGIDGFLTKCYNESRVDGYEFLKSHGSYTFKARTAIQEVSAPGWSNILCALDTEDTGVINNDWNAPWLYKKPQNITPITGNDKPFPCAFEQFKHNNKSLKTSAFYSWEWFVNLGNVSIPGSLDREMFCMMDEMNSSIVCDQQAIETGLKVIKSLDWDFFFLYFGSLDETGHATRFCSKTYTERVSVINDYIKLVIEELHNQGIFNSTYIVMTSDHGAGYMTYQHGEVIDDENLLVPWIIVGPNIKENYEIEKLVKNADTMPTILHAMGLKQNMLWRSIPIYDAFNNFNSTNKGKFLAK